MIEKSFRAIRGRLESDRLDAVATIQEASNDVTSRLNDDLSSGDSVRIRGALKILEARPDEISHDKLVRLLGSGDASIADAAAATLRIAGVKHISRASLALDMMNADSDEFVSAKQRIAKEQAYVVARTILIFTAAPGYFEGQFDAFSSAGPWVATTLTDLIVLAEGVEEPLRCAMLDVADAANTIPEIDYSFMRFLGHGNQIGGAVNRLRGRVEREKNETRALQYAIEAVNRLRRCAAQALGALPDSGVVLDALERCHANVVTNPVDMAALQDLSGEISLIEELEIGFARHGAPEKLELRLAGLRLTVAPADEQLIDADGAIVANGVSGMVTSESTGLHPQAHKRIAFLMLRSGQIDEAIVEYVKLIRRLEENVDEYGNDIGISAYNLACAYARKGETSESFEYLKHAVVFGYDTFHHYEWMLLDGDLAPLRATPEFREWYAGIAPPYLVRKLDEANATASDK